MIQQLNLFEKLYFILTQIKTSKTIIFSYEFFHKLITPKLNGFLLIHSIEPFIDDVTVRIVTSPGLQLEIIR